ncbi:MAG: response regulator transcription factor [Chloroflexi bacterium]|nr:response regulator transcription factor [Chloroflexota bacterium]
MVNEPWTGAGQDVGRRNTASDEFTDRYELLIVDGDRLQRDLLELFLNPVPELRAVRVANDLESAVHVAGAFKPDVVLIDTPATAGFSRLEIGRAIRAKNPGAGIVILADREDAQLLRGSVFADGPGWSYVLKETCKGAGDLVQIILGTASGMAIVDPIYFSNSGIDRVPPLQFTDRQREVLALVADGLSNEAVAEKLGITVRTVEYHRNEVYQRLDHSKSPYLNPRVLAATHFVRTEAVRAFTLVREEVA